MNEYQWIKGDGNSDVLKQAIKIERNGLVVEKAEINQHYISYESYSSKGSYPLFMLKDETKKFLKENGYNDFNFEN